MTKSKLQRLARQALLIVASTAILVVETAPRVKW